MMKSSLVFASRLMSNESNLQLPKCSLNNSSKWSFNQVQTSFPLDPNYIHQNSLNQSNNAQNYTQRSFLKETDLKTVETILQNHIPTFKAPLHSKWSIIDSNNLQSLKQKDQHFQNSKWLLKDSTKAIPPSKEPNKDKLNTIYTTINDKPPLPSKWQLKDKLDNLQNNPIETLTSPSKWQSKDKCNSFQCATTDKTETHSKTQIEDKLDDTLQSSIVTKPLSPLKFNIKDYLVDNLESPIVTKPASPSKWNIKNKLDDTLQSPIVTKPLSPSKWNIKDKLDDTLQSPLVTNPASPLKWNIKDDLFNSLESPLAKLSSPSWNINDKLDDTLPSPIATKKVSPSKWNIKDNLVDKIESPLANKQSFSKWQIKDSIEENSSTSESMNPFISRQNHQSSSLNFYDTSHSSKALSNNNQNGDFSSQAHTQYSNQQSNFNIDSNRNGFNFSSLNPRDLYSRDNSNRNGVNSTFSDSNKNSKTNSFIKKAPFSSPAPNSNFFNKSSTLHSKQNQKFGSGGRSKTQKPQSSALEQEEDAEVEPETLFLQDEVSSSDRKKSDNNRKKKPTKKPKNLEHDKYAMMKSEREEKTKLKKQGGATKLLSKKVLEKIQKEKERVENEKMRVVVVPDAITVSNLSSLVGVTYDQLCRVMREQGLDEEQTDAAYILNADLSSMLALEFNIEIVIEKKFNDLVKRPDPESWDSFPTRAPVVAIMGHIDHGKTTLLDSLRKNAVNITDGEAGGITQHIGAFSVELEGKKITFLDTPGHFAFSKMRERGALATDICILCVAGDDGVMPQTVEAINQCLAANVPIVVAINKCDKPGLELKKVKEGLLQHNITIEEYGGDTPVVEISALKQIGLKNLEETILTLSEVLDFRGDEEGPSESIVLESKLDIGKGNVATVVVKRGTIRVGDFLVSGSSWCKVRGLFDERGGGRRNATCSQAVEVCGWKTLPGAGELCIQTDSEEKAKYYVENRLRLLSKQLLTEQIELQNTKLQDHTKIRDEMRVLRDSLNVKRYKRKSLSQLEIENRVDKVGLPQLNLIIKADVDGTLEAIENAIAGLPQHEVAVEIVSSGVGIVTASDIELGLSTNAMVIAFNVEVDKNSEALARLNPDFLVSTHRVIYSLLDSIKENMSSLLPKQYHQEPLGELKILEVFNFNVRKKIFEKVAGCKVESGKIVKGERIKVMRGEEEMWDGVVKNLKHFKKDVMELAKGQECGVGLDFQEFDVGDRIQCYKTVENVRRIT